MERESGTGVISLRRDDPQARELLWSGEWRGRRVIAREWEPRGDVVHFQAVDLSALNFPKKGPLLFQVTRAYSLTATALPCAIAWAWGLRQGLSVQSLWVAACAFFGAVFFQVAINLFNDVEDHMRLVDLPGLPGGSGAIQKGWISARSLNRWAWGALLLGGALGLPAVIQNPALLLGVGALGVVGVLGYSARRFGFKYFLLGDVAVAVLCGPALVFGMGGAVFGASFLEKEGAQGAWALSTVMGLLAMGILHANNTEDIELDRSRGVRTWAAQLGFRRARWGMAVLYAGAAWVLVGACFAGWLPWGVGAAAGVMVGLGGALAVAFLRAEHVHSASIAGGRVRAAQVHLASGLAVLLGLIV